MIWGGVINSTLDKKGKIMGNIKGKGGRKELKEDETLKPSKQNNILCSVVL